MQFEAHRRGKTVVWMILEAYSAERYNKSNCSASRFVLAVIIFSFMTNQTNEDLTTEMSEATLPVLTLYDGKTAINELYGYTEKMDAAYMRDTITPIGEDRLLPVTVKTYQTAVDKISYEIRSLDAKG